MHTEERAQEDLLIQEVEESLFGRTLRFSGRGGEDHVAAIFTDPRLKPAPKNEVLGSVRSVKEARFAILEWCTFKGRIHYKVQILESHRDGETIGWLPEWQVTFEEKK